MDNSNRPDIRAYIGTTGSGKGVGIREHLTDDKPKRLAAWDPLGEYGDFVTLTTGDLAVFARECAKGNFRIAFYPGPDTSKFPALFALFCRIVFAAGNCTVLVEELSDLTTASHAPQPWRRLTKQGRHRGLRIIAGTQRPADVDKNFFGGCTYIRCHTLRYLSDEKAMAACMKVSLTDIQALTTVESGRTTTINYIETDFRTRKTTKGSKKLTRK